jgi:hypothetical protein
VCIIIADLHFERDKRVSTATPYQLRTKYRQAAVTSQHCHR